jgi:F-type H+-transporting ATPase subunit gamma
MSSDLDNLTRKRENARQLHSVVQTMKSLASVTIGQFEEAAVALKDYSDTVERGLVGYLKGVPDTERIAKKTRVSRPSAARISILFGTDLGMVGSFNEYVSEAALADDFPGSQTNYYLIGERMAESLETSRPGCFYSTPYSRSSLITLITKIIKDLIQVIDARPQTQVKLYYNRLEKGIGSSPVCMRILPLDEDWYRDYRSRPWSSRVIPEVIYNDSEILAALTQQFLFIELFKAGAEAIMAENAARMEYMEQAEKKIDEMLEELTMEIRRTRQKDINNELLDIVSAFEALVDT